MPRTVRLLVCIPISGLASGLQGVNIVTVPVGNPGNTGELSGAGAGTCGMGGICGAVPYEYNVGKYEVTARQYTAFLNAVGGVGPQGQ